MSVQSMNNIHVYAFMGTACYITQDDQTFTISL